MKGTRDPDALLVMSAMFDANWQKLVQATRRRPLIWMAVAVRTDRGVELRSSRRDRFFAGPLAVALGGVFTWGGWAAGWWLGYLVALTAGPGVVLLGLHLLLFPASMKCPDDSDVLHVRYGFVLFPHRIVLERRGLQAVLTIGSRTQLPKRSGNFPTICLRRGDAPQTAHVGFQVRMSKARAAFEGLVEMAGGDAVDETMATIELADGTTIAVRKTATWAGGTQYRYHSELTFPEPGVVEIDRSPLARSEKYPLAPAYPVRLLCERDELRIRSSDGSEKHVPWRECAGIQLCRGESATTRYELNLITDDEDPNRINLVSCDAVPDGHLAPTIARADPKEMGRQLAEALGLAYYDHVM